MNRPPLRTPTILLALLAACLISPQVFACSGRLHLETGPSGVYQASFADITAAQPGLAGCDIDQLRMRNQGEEVPLHIRSSGNGTFGEGDRIEWIGDKLHGEKSWSDPFSLVNVYELDAASGSRLRFADSTDSKEAMLPQAASLARHMHLEDDRMMVRLKTSQVERGEQPDVWYWGKLTMVDPRPFTTTFDLPGLRRDLANPSITLAFRGLSTLRVPKDEAELPDHEVTVRLNGQPVATLNWDGERHIEHEVRLPPDLLRDRNNVLELSVPPRKPGWAKNAVVDVVMFDYIDLHYPLAARNADGREPIEVRIAGTLELEQATPPLLYGSDGVLYRPAALPSGRAGYSLAAPGTVLYPLAPDQTPLSPVALRAVNDSHDWRSPDSAYDYIIIAHPSLMQAIEPLAEFHRQRGLKTVVIDVNDAYDQFNHGIVNPTAIRDLLKHAWEHWPAPQPRYVLLVGDASFDIHDELRDQKFYSKWADRELLIPDQFGIIPGTPYENMPDKADARNLLPTFQYYSHEGQSASDNAFVAFDPDSDKPQMAIGRFPVIAPDEVTAIVDKTIDYVLNPRMGAWRQSVMFITNDDESFQRTSDQLAAEISDLGFAPSKIYPQSSDKDNTEHQQRLMDDLADGQLLVHFLGHGGRYIWRTGPPDPKKNHDLFTLDNVAQLNNAGRLPMVLSMTCYSAPFDNPTEDSIGEKFLREKDNGAIAVFAASWRNAPDVSFSTQLMAELVKPGTTIGDAILTAKQATSNKDMIGMYNLLGDPAIALQRPREQLEMAQVRDRWNPAVTVRVPGVNDFNGQLRVDWLDEEHNVVSSNTYEVNTPSLRLPAAPPNARQVRAYALDPAHANDALGELTLAEEKPKQAKRPWWKPAPKPKPLPPASDRIHGSNFGG